MFIHGDDDHDLGHTVAGWSGAGIAVLGFGLCGLALIKASGLLALAGVAVLVLALLTTWLLHLTGWGKPSGPRPASQWDWRVRDVTARDGHSDCLGCRIAGRRTSRGQVAERPAEGVVADAVADA
ncbi:HGxxPAAW family protein [Streptomyces sp. NPDC059445]|uniref:HGxxPAAW family protein n=1 Tax=Streptomyces sp. NPDC059445 TaxID=3346832 RepID=UPI003690F534